MRSLRLSKCGNLRTSLKPPSTCNTIHPTIDALATKLYFREIQYNVNDTINALNCLIRQRSCLQVFN